MLQHQQKYPKPIALKRCKHVTIKNITIRNAPNYAISVLGTDYVNIDGVNIFNGYCDGIDTDSCRHVRIANCQIETWDDAIVHKASFSIGIRRQVANFKSQTLSLCPSGKRNRCLVVRIIVERISLGLV